jgi:Plasmid pRiA4b ORF-3-like protein
MSANTVARLKITLDVVKPTVLRRIEVPFDIRLDRLHLTIQAALGWTNSHLYEIRAGDVGWSTLYPEADWPEDFLDARKARLDKVIEDVGTKRLRYIYDFGDGWEHTIKIEQLIDPEPGVLYPRLIAATGRCPPEDCGGPWGYAEFLDAIRDPAHERNVELKEWIGCDFDPDNVDIEELAAHVAMLAKRCARTPATRRLPAPCDPDPSCQSQIPGPGRMLTSQAPSQVDSQNSQDRQTVVASV